MSTRRPGGSSPECPSTPRRPPASSSPPAATTSPWPWSPPPTAGSSSTPTAATPPVSSPSAIPRSRWTPPPPAINPLPPVAIISAHAPGTPHASAVSPRFQQLPPIPQGAPGPRLAGHPPSRCEVRLPAPQPLSRPRHGHPDGAVRPGSDGAQPGGGQLHGGLLRHLGVPDLRVQGGVGQPGGPPLARARIPPGPPAEFPQRRGISVRTARHRRFRPLGDRPPAGAPQPLGVVANRGRSAGLSPGPRQVPGLPADGGA